MVDATDVPSPPPRVCVDCGAGDDGTTSIVRRRVTMSGAPMLCERCRRRRPLEEPIGA